jgi:prolyl 4-hydroxylase
VYAGHFDFTKPLFWTVGDLYSEAECAAILSGAADGPWLAATVNRSEGRRVDERVRNDTVAVLRDSALAASAFERVKPHVPETMTTEVDSSRVELTVRGVHQPLRIYRYEVGQYFGVHEDQSYFADDGSQSLLTFMVYLNDDFE